MALFRRPRPGWFPFPLFRAHKDGLALVCHPLVSLSRTEEAKFCGSERRNAIPAIRLIG